MSEITWSEPPALTMGGKPAIFTEALVEAMRNNPGRWALIKKGHSNGAVASAWAKRHPDFEVTCRGPRGGMDIYARYIGGVQS